MDRVWSPWRMQFIKELSEKKEGCIFCKMKSSADDRDSLILYRGKKVFIVMNRYPYTNGHLLVVPYKHAASLNGLDHDEYGEMLSLASASVDIMTKELFAEGFNCGFNLGKAAGAGIDDHIHLHVVPRWVGDINFLPVLSNTRSIPEYLHESYDKLIKGFKKLDSRGKK